MQGLRKSVRGIALVGAAVLLLGAKQPKVGDLAPPFVVTLIDGSKISSEQLRGQVVVLNFWATWCGPCKAELPLLDAYYELQKVHGLKVYAIATEDSVPAFQLRKLFAQLHITPARGIKGPYDTLGAVPTNFIIDRSGHVRYAKASAFGLDALNAELVPLLKEAAPPLG
ncbi:TlpA disulfide reductase family protein [Sphingomonas sp. CARO-RG-8B-R24-01]|uniref:TlpA family protein disulfide reductase n=1 Tax=Sphingomonas sp. CARO-RG-8B-R24-01 TaxID=2914831 RepID=UPI001F5AE804|nr:TlpA disulfide reductase family protein [Sphingomonas sp. CARO-RG-8B-R24-01]